jgi:hypothetical protein
VSFADLATNFDPIWTAAYVACNELLVWDTLYGIDAKREPRRQMVDVDEVGRRDNPKTEGARP